MPFPTNQPIHPSIHPSIHLSIHPHFTVYPIHTSFLDNETLDSFDPPRLVLGGHKDAGKHLLTNSNLDTIRHLLKCEVFLYCMTHGTGTGIYSRLVQSLFVHNKHTPHKQTHTHTHTHTTKLSTTVRSLSAFLSKKFQSAKNSNNSQPASQPASKPRGKRICAHWQYSISTNPTIDR